MPITEVDELQRTIHENLDYDMPASQSKAETCLFAIRKLMVILPSGAADASSSISWDMGSLKDLKSNLEAWLRNFTGRNVKHLKVTSDFKR